METLADSWLDVLEQQINVDVDSMSPSFISSLHPFVFNDMTSNQGYVHEQMCHPDNEDLLRKITEQYKGSGWLEVYTRMAVLMCKANIGSIKGRVLLQALPSFAYDTDKTVEHARAYARAFEEVGIPKDHFCIKIMTTGPAMRACSILREEGIRTLGTAVFSVHQAVAASQAGCLYISPYYNESLAAIDPDRWPKSGDPALLHPFSPRLLRILDTYKRLYKRTGKEQPFVKLAGFLSVQEAMAAGEMGCHSATISAKVLKELSLHPYQSHEQPGEGIPKPEHPYSEMVPLPNRLSKLVGVDPLDSSSFKEDLDPAVDYLANNGINLDIANNADLETKRRLAQSLEGFIAAEKRSRVKIEALMNFA